MACGRPRTAHEEPPVSIGTVANTLEARRAEMESVVVEELEASDTDLEAAEKAPPAPRRSRRTLSDDDQEPPRSRRTVVDEDDDEDLGLTRARPAWLDEKRASRRTRRTVENDEGVTAKQRRETDARRRRERDEANSRGVAERQEAAASERRREIFEIESKQRDLRSRGIARDAGKPAAKDPREMEASTHLARLLRDEQA